MKEKKSNQTNDRKYFGDDAVGDVGLDAIAELNGIGDRDGEEGLRRGRRSRALRRTGDSSLLFHTAKQPSTCNKKKKEKRKKVERKKKEEGCARYLRNRVGIEL